MTLNQYYTLSNGVKIPKIGFGTAPLKGDDAYWAVRHAIDAGYRHIDTAQTYGNEADVGRAIKDCGVARDKLFVTTKVDSRIKTHEETIAAFHDSLRRLNLEYVDLYLIHAPWAFDDIGSDHASGNVEVFKAFEKLYEDGLVRAIGVSNFDRNDLSHLIEHTSMVPHVNQIKRHIGFPQDETEAFCDAHSIQIEAYSPLGRGVFFDDDTLRSIADEYGVHPAQIAVGYLLQKGMVVLPRSSKKHNIRANGTIDFTLSDAQMRTLDSLRFL